MSERESLRGKRRATARSRTSRAGLQFPVGRIHRFLRKRNYGRRFSSDAPVFLAAVMEYMTAEILVGAGIAALRRNSCLITPRHLQLAMHRDVELDKLLKNVIVAQGGIVPKIQAEPRWYVQINQRSQGI